MATSPHPGTGLLDSLRGFGDTLLRTAHNRFELFTTELHEEKYRLVQIFLWISAVVFSGMMALMLASVTLVYLFWETARLGVLVGLTAFYAASCLAVVLLFRSYLARQEKPFAATLGELEEDRECIQREI
jgi:uncharacterized membrane protein YqjE